MALAQTSVRDAYELRLFLELGNRSAAKIPHPGAESTHKLVHHGLERSAIRHTPLDPFGHELRKAILIRPLPLDNALGAQFCAEILRALEVAFPGSLAHR